MPQTTAASRPEQANVDVDAYLSAGGSVRTRLEACLRDHVGEVVARQDLQAVAGGAENWHQRLSELRTNFGYTIETNRDRPGVLKPGEYVLVSLERRQVASRRVVPTAGTWAAVLQRSGNVCEWTEDGTPCGLGEGERDPVGGGTVRLTADHRTPHSVVPDADPDDPAVWAALCGRHQVKKKNFFDSRTGKLNLTAAVQAASLKDKRELFELLKGILADVEQ